MRNLLRALGAALILSFATLPARAQETVTVFAAASLKNAMDEAIAGYKAKTGVTVVASYAASSALAKQIEQAAPADIFVSADQAWMDYLAERSLINASTRSDLLGNALVVVGAKGASAITLDKAGITAALGDGKLAVGEVKSVPAGRYAKAALEHLGLWGEIEPKLAQTENVRAALALVARGEAPLGIVYATDALIEPGVSVVATFAADSHPPIVYPVALTVSAKPAAAAFLAYLQSPDATAIFTKAGFTLPAKPQG